MKKTIKPFEDTCISSPEDATAQKDSILSEAIEVPRDRPQTARETNIEAFIAYFESGITDDDTGLGIELEHTIISEANLEQVSYSQDKGISWVLEQLSSDYGEKITDFEGDLLGLMRPGEAITLEPAAQLEISAGPFETLDAAMNCFESFETRLEDVLAPVGKRALLTGYHPKAKACELELIPKKRYEFMDYYLGKIGPYGTYMMRGTASTQVSIDYSSVDDCLRKLRIAFALTPIFSLMCDNSPTFEGKPRTHQLARTEIWLKCDPERCNLVPGVMDKNFSLRSYAEYILDTPAILVPCNKREWCYTENTFGELYADKPMQRSDIEHALSMFFTDVRLKTYVEIRPADALPIPYAIAYAALIKGLFYSNKNLDQLDKILCDVQDSDVIEAKYSLMAKGYNAQVYHMPVAELADTLIGLAKSALDQGDRDYLEPLADLVMRRTTLAALAENNRV